MLQKEGIEVLFDDRHDMTAGEKFAESDLIGIPHRVIISKKTLEANGVEYINRAKDTKEILSPENLMTTLQNTSI